MSIKDELTRTQKKIYHALKAEAEQLLGETPAPIVAYDREYQKDFKRVTRPSAGHFKTLNKRQLIHEIRAADVTLIADFHTFAQAQRTALRIIRDTIRPGEEWWIGIEMVPSHFQNELDLFQAGKISLKEFHKKIDYRSEWGFPWKHYKPLFDWAREHQVRLIALNRPKELFYPFSSNPRALIDLRKRDEWAAGIITDQFAAQSSNKRARMLILYGELHVGRSHLPADIQRVSKYFLKKPLTCVSVHQNHDGLFWNLAKRKSPVETIRIGPSNYCVFSSTPWAKLQSLVTWAESFSDPSSSNDDSDSEDSDDSNSSYSNSAEDYEDDYLDEYEDDEDEVGNLVVNGAIGTPGSRSDKTTDRRSSLASEKSNAEKSARYEAEQSESEFEADYHHWISTYSDFLTELFKVPSPEIESATIKTVEEADFLTELFKKERPSAFEKKALRFQIENNVRTYIPRSEILYVASPTQNGAAELAAMYMFRHMNGSQTLYSGSSEDFYQRVLESMFGFFGSLLVNPKRKCDLPRDHERRLHVLRRQNTRDAVLEKLARKLALSFESSRKGPQALTKELDRLLGLLLHKGEKGQLASVLAAHYIGRILAKKMHHALMEDHINLEEIKLIVLRPATKTARFHAKKVQQLIRAVAKEKIEKSKQDRL